MKKLNPIQFLSPLAVLGFFLAGCTTPNVNPPQARAHTGYVDFQADVTSELCWEVARFEARSQSFHCVYSKLSPPAGGWLRLAFAPGRHHLRVTLLNRVIASPAGIEVAVQDGMVTPVRVTLAETGTVFVKTTDVSHGATAKGRYGQRTKIGSTEAVTYRLSAMTDAPVAYQTKERMSHAR